MLSYLARRRASTRAAHGLECFVWGSGAQGALGLGDLKDCLLPEIVEFDDKDEDVRVFAAGPSHSCVLDTNNHLWTFDYGRLGLQEKTTGVLPVPNQVNVSLESDDFITGVDCGHYHTAAVSKKGYVFTWGWGGRWISGCGGLGHGDMASETRPKRVDALAGTRIVLVRCGKYHTLALDEGGRVYSWGRGEYGRLGLNSNRDVHSPEIIPDLTDIVSLSTCNATSAAIDRNGRVFMWGKNDTGQLGVGGSSNLDMFALESIPTLIEGMSSSRVVDISCSDRHTIACTDDGRVFIWGDRQWMSPYQLRSAQLGGSPVRQVAAGHGFSALVTAAGNVFTWGSGRSLCLGHGDKETLRDPTLLEAFLGRVVHSIVAGGTHVGALVHPNTPAPVAV